MLQIMDVGWPELHAPPLDKMCTICKAQESWLNSDPQHVVVIHCRVSAPTSHIWGSGWASALGVAMENSAASEHISTLSWCHVLLMGVFLGFSGKME